MGQLLHGELLVEIAAHGVGLGGSGQVAADRFEGLRAGRSCEQDIVEMMALACVALGFERQMLLKDVACRMQGLCVGERWRIVHGGLVLLVIVRWLEQSSNAGQALCCGAMASAQIRIY